MVSMQGEFGTSKFYSDLRAR